MLEMMVWQKIVFFGVGGTILLLSAIISVGWPIYFFTQLEKQLVLTNDSKSYNLWKETPIPMYMDIYMFNWTNPEETLQKGAKPHFVEMGPYVFSENHKKVNVTWNANNTVTFKQIRKWNFNPLLSKGTLNDSVTNLNVIAFTVGNMIARFTKDNEILNILANKLIKYSEKSIYVTKSVRELLFDGYDDTFLDIAQKLKPTIKINIPFDRFGWFYTRNNSADYDGVFNMNTGARSISELGNVNYWNYRNNTATYKGGCGMVNGTSGELWPYNAARQRDIQIFATDICSSITLKSTDVSASVEGVGGNVFVGDEGVFDNGQKEPSNACYCSKSSFPCPPSGARDISTCRFGAPAFISYPHFYLADQYYRNAVDGLSPDKEKHGFYLVLEKATSIPVEVHGRLQINILCQSIPGLNFFEGLPTAYMPMVWFDQRARITPDLAAQLQSLHFLDSYLELIFIGCAVFGFLMIIAGLLLWGIRAYLRRRSQSTPLLSSPQASYDGIES